MPDDLHERHALLSLLSRPINPGYDPNELEAIVPERILSSAEVKAITEALDHGVRSLSSLVATLGVTSPALAAELAPYIVVGPLGALLD